MFSDDMKRNAVELVLCERFVKGRWHKGEGLRIYQLSFVLHANNN